MRSYCAEADRACSANRADPIGPITLRDVATRTPTPAASQRASGAARSRRSYESARARSEKFVVPPLGGILPSRNDLFSCAPSPLRSSGIMGFNEEGLE